MAEDLQRTVRQRGIQLGIPYNEVLVNEGFVTDLSRGPIDHVTICLRPDEAERWEISVKFLMIERLCIMGIHREVCMWEGDWCLCMCHMVLHNILLFW